MGITNDADEPTGVTESEIVSDFDNPTEVAQPDDFTRQDDSNAESAPETPDWITLESGEELVWISGPSRWTYVGLLASTVIISLVVAVIVFNGRVDVWIGPVPIDYLLLYVVFALAVPTALKEIRHQKTTYLLTSKQLWYKSGIITVYTEQIQLHNVETIEYDQSFRDRALSIGDIYVSTAGSRDYDMILEEISDPAQKCSDVMLHQDEVSKGIEAT
jgi:membrane protein YdbS with pleckstrin-like domain